MHSPEKIHSGGRRGLREERDGWWDEEEVEVGKQEYTKGRCEPVNCRPLEPEDVDLVPSSTV